ncbi:MAG TPA: GYF domain-containing protein, partial [Bryobacteraceae bacterium]
MNPAGQWYYLSGSTPTGPIPQTKLFELIKSGELIPSVQVAAAGWQQWQPASAVFPELASAAPVAAPAPTIAMSPSPSPSPVAATASTASMPAVSPRPTAPTQTIMQPEPIVAAQPKAEAARPTVVETQPSVSQVRPSYQSQPQAPSPLPFQPQPQPAFQPQPQMQPQFQPHGQFGAPAPTAIPAVQLRCLAGPDADKVFIISSAEVLLGRASGIGQSDPALADQHLTLCWQNNALYYRMLGGQIRIDGVIPPPTGVLQLGQSFQMGSSIWQVNSQTATLGGLLDSLGKRLNSLASTEKLEGFSLSGMFSETFKKRAQEEVDEYFICGTSKTTPAIEKAVTGWPKPWFFMRVLIFLAATFFLFWLGWREFTNTNLLPGMMMIGAMVIPLAVVILFFELNTPRNVSFFNAIGLLCVGGVLSIFVALIGFQVSGLDSILGPPAAGVIEEIGKLVTVIILARNTRQ